MIWFKACPRCGGEISVEKDAYGTYLSCLQCGYCLSKEEAAALVEGHLAPSTWRLGGPSPSPVRWERPEAV